MRDQVTERPLYDAFCEALGLEIRIRQAPTSLNREIPQVGKKKPDEVFIVPQHYAPALKP